MEKIDLVKTEEFQAWRNGLYDHFEKTLYASLVEKWDEFGIWRAPDTYLITIHDCILLEYASVDARTELVNRRGSLGLFFNSEERVILKHSSEVRKSLVFRRLVEWHRISAWSCMAVYHGSYESVSRELRFLVEDVVQSLYADQQRLTDTIDEKVKWLKTNRLRGSPLINAVDLVLDLKSKLIDLYKELSDYVHPSVELIQMDIENRRIYFEYLGTWFDKMFEFHNRVFDLVLVLVMFRFPKAIKRFLEYQNIEELEKDGYENTISMIELQITNIK